MRDGPRPVPCVGRRGDGGTFPRPCGSHGPPASVATWARGEEGARRDILAAVRVTFPRKAPSVPPGIERPQAHAWPSTRRMTLSSGGSPLKDLERPCCMAA
ncbi:hypothetical protein SEA_JACKIEB_38 [Streptomyces phage JackieB]|nr:hypothetical protein SEA_JACKIEB_38 [Streptomyces phage JackieB]